MQDLVNMSTNSKINFVPLPGILTEHNQHLKDCF